MPIHFFTAFVITFSLSFVSFVSLNSPSNSLTGEGKTQLGVSVIKFDKAVNDHGVIININQGASFNHTQQLKMEYLCVALLSIFFVSIAYYRHFKPILLPPPWYFALKYNSPFSVSGWKVSNLLYKSKLIFQ